MMSIKRLLFLAVITVILPGSSFAQSSLTSSLGFFIEGFASVAASEPVLETDSAIEEMVVYETNRVDQTVYVRVEGDLTGLELRIDPVFGQQDVLGVAASGNPGQAAPVTFREAGELPLVVGVTGAGVQLPVRYTVVPLDPDAAQRVGSIRISYAIN